MRFLCLLAFVLLYVGKSFAQVSTMMPSPHHPEFNDYYLHSENRATITGKVLNLPDSVDRDKLIGYSAVPLQRDDYKQLSADIDEDGHFSVELPYSVPAQEVWIWMGDLFYTAIIVKSSVHLEIDYATLPPGKKHEWVYSGVRFSGPDKDLSALRGKKIKEEEASGLDFFSVIGDRGLSTSQAQAKVDSVLVLLQAMDDKLLQGYDAQVSAFIKNERLTEYLALSCPLYWNEAMPPELLQQYLLHNPLAISNRGTDFYSYFSTYILNEARREVRDELGISAQEAYNHPLATAKFLEKVDSAYAPSRADLLKLYPEVKDPVTNFAMLEAILPTITTPWCKEKIEAKLEKQRREVAKLTESLASKVDIIDTKDLGKELGRLGFDADLYSSNATTGKTLLDQLRGTFPGKAIYLDLWAVWCGPCIQELPFSKKAHEAAKDLPVEFVYLCTEGGGDQEKWQNLIASHQVPGTHLFVPEAPHNELLKLLMGRGYPTYVLIKPDGTIVHDVPRPSGLNREKLEALLAGK